MAQGDRILTGGAMMASGYFNLQPGRDVHEPAEGWDTVTRQWLTHPNTSSDDADYPKMGFRDSTYPWMQCFDVDDNQEESGLKLITAQFRGAKRTNSGQATKPHFLKPDVNTQIVNLPALTGGGSSEKRTLIVPVPMPVMTRSFLTTDTVYASNPFSGVGNPASALWLPGPGSWGISYLPDTDQPLPANYYYGWVLMNRTVEPACNGVETIYTWLVTEFYQWFWGFSV